MNIIRDNIDTVELFGKDRAQEDKNLKHYFIKTSQFSQIASGSRELVLGRKGSGKSAIFQALVDEEEAHNEIPVKISFDGEDFIFIHNLLQKNDVGDVVSDDFKYSLAWKDFIISEIVYSALSRVDKLDSVLKRFLSENGLIREKTWEKFANSLLKVIKGAKLQGTSGEIDFDLEGLSNLIEADQIKLRDSINNLIRKNSFFVLIDNLDEPWKNSSEMNAWLRGLIYAIRQLKREFNNLKMVAFLRTDIFDIISKGSDLFDSKSEITTINWDDNDFFNLKLLVASRIAFYFKKPLPSDYHQVQELWDIVFPNTLHYGYAHTALLSDYIIERTFRRPRELLQFCRQIVSEGKSKYLPVEENSISPAEITYSDWKLTDLSGEYSQSYQHIDSCILSFVGAKTAWDWPCQSIIDHLETCDDNDIILDSNTGKSISTKACVEVLYKTGFFRKVIKKPGQRTKYRMYYQDPTINYQNTVFDIHPAFRKKFVQY